MKTLELELDNPRLQTCAPTIRIAGIRNNGKDNEAERGEGCFASSDPDMGHSS